MKDKSKILLIVIVAILVVTLISTLVLSSVYAKYVTGKNAPASSVRPAGFELIMETPMDDKIEVNFAADGEPGAPIGYTETFKNYDFAVQTSGSEVASDYKLSITFNDKITAMIRQARINRFEDGIWCDYVVIQGRETNQTDTNGNPIVTYDEKNDVIAGNESGSSKITWEHNVHVNPNENPGNLSGKAHYRLKLIVYNNTMMPNSNTNRGNGEKYVLASNGINIEVITTQTNPEYVGEYSVN